MSNEGPKKPHNVYYRQSRYRKYRSTEESNKSEMPIEGTHLHTSSTRGSVSNKPNELRLVLLGKTGAGKSASGNTILGEECFLSEVNMSSVTKECKKECRTVKGRNLLLVDTPGLFDTELTPEELQQEVIRCLTLCSPGPHAFLLVIPIERYTEEQQRTVEMIRDLFQDITQHTIIVFSHADKLKGTSIEEFISQQNEKVQELVERFGKRYVALNNMDPNPGQVARLLERVDEMLEKNNNTHFTNPVTEAVAQAQKIMEERLAERKKNIRAAVQKMADDRWAAFTADMTEDRKDSERKKKRVQRRIDQLETDIKNEEQNVNRIPERLKRFRAYLEIEHVNLRRLEEDEIERMEREQNERMNLNRWRDEEQRRRESEEMKETGNDSQYNKYLIMLIMFLLGVGGVGGAACAPALLAFLFPAAPVVEATLAAQILAQMLNLGAQGAAFVLPAAAQALKIAALTRCSIQ